MLRIQQASFVALLSLCSAWSISTAGTLTDGVFETSLTDNVAPGDPIPTVRLFFDGLVKPFSVEKRTDTDADTGFSLDVYYFQIPEDENRLIVEYEVTGDLTGTPSLSGTNDEFDWSSRTGISANPFAMQTSRYYRLTMTSNAPSRVSGLRTDYFHFAIEQSSGPQPPEENQPPEISLLPESSDTLAFQQSILSGHGFTLHAADPDGVTDLDWNTLRVWVAGVDKTAHFLSIASLVNVDTAATDTALSIFLMPDPEQFMEAHNFFNIQWNGDWPIKLQLCDQGGLCAEAEYTIYFGPFMKFANALDQRCSDNSIEAFQALRMQDYLIGNTGFTVSVGRLFLGLQRQSQIWTYVSVLGFPTLRDGVNLLYAISLPAGFRFEGEMLDLSLFVDNPDSIDDVALSNDYLLGTGAYILTAVMLDDNYGAARVFQQPVQVCTP